MSRRIAGFFAFGGIVGLGLWAVVSRLSSAPDIPMVDVSQSQRVREEPEDGLCPWRDPKADLKQFFAANVQEQEEVIVLSRKRQEIGKRLGRVPTGDENLLRVYRIRQKTKLLGTVIPRRLRGESGVIEIVIAVDTHGKVIGAKLQRLREPNSIAKILRSSEVLGRFAGKTAQSAWHLGTDFAQVDPAAKISAAAILNGTRTALILLDAGENATPNVHH